MVCKRQRNGEIIRLCMGGGGRIGFEGKNRRRLSIKTSHLNFFVVLFVMPVWFLGRFADDLVEFHFQRHNF